MVVAVAQASFLACKSPTQPLLAVAFAAIANLLGDVLLVVVCGWGIAGAAWATVAAQITMGVALVYLLLKEGNRRSRFGNEFIDISTGKTVPDGQGPPSLRKLPVSFPSVGQTKRFLQIAGTELSHPPRTAFAIAHTRPAKGRLRPEGTISNPSYYGVQYTLPNPSYQSRIYTSRPTDAFFYPS
jgi:hypothetical protein